MLQPRPYSSNYSLYNPDLSRDVLLSGLFCARPWEFFEITTNGSVTACCPAWLPKIIGRMPEETMAQIWNSAEVKEIRLSILDGSFSFCKASNCPLIASNSLPKLDEVVNAKHQSIIQNRKIDAEEIPSHWNLCYDNSCNLFCPSCRLSRINYSQGEEYEKKEKIQKHVIAAIFQEPHTNKITVNMSGAGDPFGSKLYMDLLINIDGRLFPNVKFDLQTNGVLFSQKNFDAIWKLHNNIGNVVVSFDAATETTYKLTRRGGNYDILLKNLLMLDYLRSINVVKHLRIDFVVQWLNYIEMPMLINVLNDYPSIDQITFSLINNWGTFTEEDFNRHAIWRRDHPEFNNFMAVLRNPILSDKKIYFGNVMPYYKLAKNMS